MFEFMNELCKLLICYSVLWITFINYVFLSVKNKNLVIKDCIKKIMLVINEKFRKEGDDFLK